MELISVIVPVYKVELYLDRCIQSIVDQTYTNLEIILVDDGSPDCCPLMCDEWAKKDHRIKVIHKENGGLSDARNAGMAVAKGEYIAFVDSDDWVSLRYIEKLYEAIRVSGARLAACGVQFVEEKKEDEEQRQNAGFEMFTAEQAFSPDGWKRVRAVAWNKLYHHLLLDGERYPVGKYHEDEFFTYQIVDKAGCVAFVQEELYFYYQRPGSIMHRFSLKHLDVLEAYMQRLQLFKERYPELYLQEKANSCVAFANLYCGALNENVENLEEAERKIKAYRGQLRFLLWDFARYSLKQNIYILGTGWNLPLFCRMLHMRRGKAYEKKTV